MCQAARRVPVAPKVEKIVGRGRRRWLMCVFFGHDHQTRKGRHRNRSIHGRVWRAHPGERESGRHCAQLTSTQATQLVCVQGDACEGLHSDCATCSPVAPMRARAFLHNPSRRGKRVRPERDRGDCGLGIEVAVVRIGRSGISACRQFVLYYAILSTGTTRAVTSTIHVAVGTSRN